MSLFNPPPLQSGWAATSSNGPLPPWALWFQNVWAAINGSLGYQQTWSDVTASRVLGSSYTAGAKPIQVNITMTSTSSAYAILTIGSLQVFGSGGAAGIPLTVSAIVPPGASYVASVSAGTPTLQRWTEFA